MCALLCGLLRRRFALRLVQLLMLAPWCAAVDAGTMVRLVILCNALAPRDTSARWAGVQMFDAFVHGTYFFPNILAFYMLVVRYSAADVNNVQMGDDADQQ